MINSIDVGDFVRAGKYCGVVDTIYLTKGAVIINTYNGIKPCTIARHYSKVKKITEEQMVAWKAKHHTSYPTWSKKYQPPPIEPVIVKLYPDGTWEPVG